MYLKTFFHKILIISPTSEHQPNHVSLMAKITAITTCWTATKYKKKKLKRHPKKWKNKPRILFAIFQALTTNTTPLQIFWFQGKESSAIFPAKQTNRQVFSRHFQNRSGNKFRLMFFSRVVTSRKMSNKSLECEKQRRG